MREKKTAKVLQRQYRANLFLLMYGIIQYTTGTCFLYDLRSCKTKETILH